MFHNSLVAILAIAGLYAPALLLIACAAVVLICRPGIASAAAFAGFLGALVASVVASSFDTGMVRHVPSDDGSGEVVISSQLDAAIAWGTAANVLFCIGSLGLLWALIVTLRPLNSSRGDRDQ